MDKIQQIASSFRVFSKIIEKRSNFLSTLQKPTPRNTPIFETSSPPSRHFFIFIVFALAILLAFVFKNNETVIWIRNTIEDTWNQIQQKTLAETFIRGNTVISHSPDDIRELLSL